MIKTAIGPILYTLRRSSPESNTFKQHGHDVLSGIQWETRFIQYARTSHFLLEWPAEKTKPNLKHWTHHCTPPESHSRFLHPATHPEKPLDSIDRERLLSSTRKNIERDSRSQQPTWFTREAFLRCCAPPAPILLLERCSVVSVCEDGGHGTSGTLHCQCLTWFTRKVSPRRCAPSLPIRLLERCSVVSVCEDGGHGTSGTLPLSVSHLVHSQGLAEMLRSSITDNVARKMQCCECLWWWRTWNIGYTPLSVSHLVHSQGLAETLRSSSPDTVTRKMQCCECLWWWRT